MPAGFQFTSGKERFPWYCSFEINMRMFPSNTGWPVTKQRKGSDRINSHNDARLEARPMWLGFTLSLGNLI